MKIVEKILTLLYEDYNITKVLTNKNLIRYDMYHFISMD